MVTDRLARRFSHPVWDIGALALLAVVYTLPVLARPGDALPLGGDFDAAIAPYAFVRESVLAFRLPLWNPYYTTGQPLLADPLATYLNPVALAPVLALGVLPGAKVAVLLSVFLAGLGAWTLGRAACLPRLLCLWAAALFMLSGNLAVRFTSGQFEHILTYPWVAFSLAFTLLALRDRRRRWLALAALSIAMLAFSGNYYFLLYAIIGAATLGVAEALLQGLDARSWRPVMTAAGVCASILALALGLAAVRLLPSLELLPRMFRIADPFVGSQHPQGVLADLVLFPRRLYGEPTLARLFGYPNYPLLWPEFYAFVGPAPLVGLAFLHRAWRQSEARRQIVAFGALGVVSVLIIANAYPYSPFHWAWQVVPGLSGFRFPVRALVLTISSLAVLSAIGYASWRATGWRRRLKAVVLVGGLAMVFVVNGWVLYSDAPMTEYGARQAIAWLRRHDPGVYYVQINERAPGEVRWRTFAEYDLLSARIKISDAYHGWYLRDSPALRRLAPQGTTAPPGVPGVLDVRARYMLVPAGQGQAFGGQGYRIMATEGDFDILQTDSALPYAFALPQGRTAEPESVRPAIADALEPGRIVMTAATEAGERVIALETWYPGWTVRVDGGPAQPVDNYMGVQSAQALSGTHQYVFEYQPLSARWGLAVSAGTAVLLLVLVIAGERRKAAPP